LRTSGSPREQIAKPLAPETHPPSLISFAPFHLDLRAGRLLRGSDPIPLRAKTWSVLRYLAERPGALVTKNELLDAVWPDAAVTESVLSKSIGELRVALDDSFKAPRLIETVQRRGFRFIAQTMLPGFKGIQPQPRDQEPKPRDREPEGSYFVGRTRDLQKLATTLARAHAGKRQVVFITGPAGIGKTALVENFLNSPAVRQARAPVWIGRGVCIEQHGVREAYMPVLAALERLTHRPDTGRFLELLHRIAPTWLAQMPWLIGDEEEALRQSLQVVRPERMLREFAALIEALTTAVTLVLVLEDLHWSDASTIDLLSLLAQGNEPARLLVIGTFRPAEAIVREHVLMSSVRTLSVRRQCTELPLVELSEEDVRHFLHVRFPGSDLPPALARLIHQHTDGNPLFMVGVVDRLRSRGDILDTAPGWALRAPVEQIDLGVPDDVRLLIENDLAELSPADSGLLQAASVAGDDFSALVVAAALGREVTDVETRCEAFAQAHRFLRVAGHVEWPDHSVARRYAFVHELYRQAVYAQITEGQCMRLHQRIGQALEAAMGARRMEIAPQLATHFEHSRDEARALQYLTAAAAGARQRFASREAIDYLEAALACVARLPDKDERSRREIELRLALGSALGDSHGFASEVVRENYERASDLCAAVGHVRQLFDVLYARWYLHAMRAEREETVAIAAQLEIYARRLRAPEYRILAESVQVRTSLYDGRFADAGRHMERLLAHQRRCQSRAAAVAYGVDPLTAASGHSAIALWFLGDAERARATAREALARARQSGHVLTLAAILQQGALVDLLCRNTAAGGELAAQAVSLSLQHGFAFWNAVASVLTGWALVQQGRASEGSAAIERALGAMQATGTRFFSAFAYAFLAEGYLRAGALTEGLAAVDAGLTVAQETLDRVYEPELWRLKGELLLEQSKVQSPKSKARREKIRHTGPDNVRDAEACLQHALELARAAQAKSLELRAATSLARRWQACGRAAEARNVLGGVCKWFGARVKSVDLAEARALLSEPAAPRRMPRPRPAGRRRCVA
jgi:DNA-binding winged helix-turn-helix (wHTH) protein/predicted ATPase